MMHGTKKSGRELSILKDAVKNIKSIAEVDSNQLQVTKPGVV